MMTDLSEIFLPQPEKRRAVEFCVAADVVVRVRMELFAIDIPPRLLCLVFALNIHRLRIPVVLFTGNVIAAFDDEDTFTRGGERIRECATARSGSDDDDDEPVHKILSRHG